MTKQVSIIRGTGFKNLDGSLVTIVEERDDGTSAVVPFGHIDFKPIIIDSRCVQKIDDKETFTYEIVVYKQQNDTGTILDLEKETLKIPNALRNVPVSTIIEYLTKHLSPLLKLE